MAAGASMGLFFSAGVVQQVTTPLTATVMARVDATHPPQHGSSSGGATVTFSNFNFDLVLQTFRFVAPDAAGWMYFAESVSFDYHIAQNSFPWVSESGTIYIFTTNQNQKTLTVAGSVNFAGVTPALDATSAAVGVEQYDLYIVGQCSDTVCLIPVSDVIDPIAQNVIPDLEQAIVTEVNAAGNEVLSRLSDVRRVALAGGWSLLLESEGGVSINADGSLSYAGAGVSLLLAPNGTMLGPPVSDPSTVPPFNPAALPANSLAIALDSYAFASFLWALGASGQLGGTITHAPPLSPIQLTTNNAFWRGAIPALANYPNLNLTVTLAPAFSWPQVSINAGSTVSFNALGFTMTINIVNGTTVKVQNAVTVMVGLNMTLSVGANETARNIVSVQLGIVSHNASVALVTSQVGPVNLASFKAIIAFAFALAKIPPMSFIVPADVDVTSVSFSTQSNVALVTLSVAAVAETPARKLRMAPPPNASRHSVVKKKRHHKPALQRRHRKQIPARPSSPRRAHSLLPGDIQLCGDGRASCDSASTCCSADLVTYNCCATPHGTCCPGATSCCPNGYGCAGDGQCAQF